MRALTAIGTNPENPLSCLRLDPDYPEPSPRQGWEIVEVKAASLNHHDLFNLRGMSGIGDRFPTVLGSDAAGIDSQGRRVLIHAVLADPSYGVDETLTRGSSLLSDRYDGAMADRVLVPSSNLVELPDELSFEVAACLPTAYLTAYRMLFTKAALHPGQRVLVQGAGGGVPTAAILLASAAGAEVAVTSRHAFKRERALDLGAAVSVETGARLPWRADVVVDVVGAPTWEHSLRSVAAEGTVVVAGATGGFSATTDLREVYRRQLKVVGSTLGSRQELADLLRLVVRSGVSPVIDEVMALEDAVEAFARMSTGEHFGKIVLRP